MKAKAAGRGKWLRGPLGIVLLGCCGLTVLGALVANPGGRPAVDSVTVMPSSRATAGPSATARVRATSRVEVIATAVVATEVTDPTITPAAEPTAVVAPTTTSAPVGPTATGQANLRAGPGKGFAAVGGVGPGERLEIVGRNEVGDWYELKGGAWIAAFLVANAPDNVPIAAMIPALPTAAPAVRAAPAVVAVPSSPLPGAELSSCDCSGNLYNCDDFEAFDAQSCFMRCMQLVGRDVHDLDRDHDGSACEWEY